MMRKVFKIIFFIFLAVFLTGVIFWGYLSYLDSKQDNKSYRAGIIYLTGLSKISFLREWFFPKIRTFSPWKETSLYWYSVDQETLKADKGYNCVIIAKLITDPDIVPLWRGWKVKTKDGQILRLNSLNNTLFYLRLSKYNEKKEQWEDEFQATTNYRLFKENDLILAEWSCPLKNPEEMLDKNNKIKQEYTEIKPMSVSKRK